MDIDYFSTTFRTGSRLCLAFLAVWATKIIFGEGKKDIDYRTWENQILSVLESKLAERAPSKSHPFSRTNTLDTSYILQQTLSPLSHLLFMPEYRKRSRTGLHTFMMQLPIMDGGNATTSQRSICVENTCLAIASSRSQLREVCEGEFLRMGSRDRYKTETYPSQSRVYSICDITHARHIEPHDPTQTRRQNEPCSNLRRFLGLNSWILVIIVTRPATRSQCPLSPNGFSNDGNSECDRSVNSYDGESECWQILHHYLCVVTNDLRHANVTSTYWGPGR